MRNRTISSRLAEARSKGVDCRQAGGRREDNPYRHFCNTPEAKSAWFAGFDADGAPSKPG